jgi:hypothetical protein
VRPPNSVTYCDGDELRAGVVFVSAPCPQTHRAVLFRRPQASSFDRLIGDASADRDRDNVRAGTRERDLHLSGEGPPQLFEKFPISVTVHLDYRSDPRAPELYCNAAAR